MSETCRRRKYQQLRKGGNLCGTIKAAMEISRARLCESGPKTERNVVYVPLGNNDRIQSIAQSLQDNHPRRQNWRSERCGEKTEVVTNDEGRYSSRCTYTHYTYSPVIRSKAIVYRTTVCYWFDNDGMSRIRAPHGYFWNEDVDGVRLVSRDGKYDYHPTAADLLLGARHCASQLRANRDTQQRLVAATRRDLTVVRQAERKGLLVCTQDSAAAGNCMVGTLGWAHRHGFNPLLHYSPSSLLAAANGDTHRVALVVLVALRRYRREIQQGYSMLADHRAN